jgi:ankyrin repeat protein
MENKLMSESILIEVNAKNYQEIDLLISNGFNINTNNGEALKAALFNNDEQMLYFLIEKGADIHIDDEYLLRHACTKGLNNLVSYLLSLGANQYILNCVPFNNVLATGNWDLADVLLSYDKENRLKTTHGFYVKNINKNIDSFHYLMRNEFPFDDENVLLREMVKVGYKNGVDFFLSRGANINFGKRSFTPLLMAVKENNEELALYLIERGADITAFFSTIMSIICKEGMLKLIKYYIEEDIFQQRVYKNNGVINIEEDIIKSSILSDNIEVLKLLSEKINFNSNAHMGLKFAVKHNKFNSVGFLINNGSNININNGELLYIAGAYHHMEMIKYLIVNNINKPTFKIDNDQIMDYINNCYQIKKRHEYIQDSLSNKEKVYIHVSKKKI